MTNIDVQRELGALRSQVQRLRFALGACLIVGLAVTLGVAAKPKAEVLRVKGIVVEDAEGRARILIGAPVPKVAERVRTDPDKVRAAWGARYSGQMDWYFENVKNETTGLLILDAHGHDRIALGSPTPDPNSGARIEPSHGLQLNDAEGIEVGGFGYFDERKIAGLGMDNPDGEGLYLLAASNGTSGMIVNDHPGQRRLFVGLATEGSGLSPSGDLLGSSIAAEDGSHWWVSTTGSGFEAFTPPAEAVPPGGAESERRSEP
jgi:hypothetical protein